MTGGLDQIRRSILALLQIAEEEGISITRTSLAKLLYFADIRAVESGGEPQSGVEWKWMHYGPYNMALKDAETALAAEGLIEVDTSQRNLFQYGEVSFKLRGTPQGVIDAQFFEIIRGSVIDFGRLNATTLSSEAYRTTPMLRAQRTAFRGCSLDLVDTSEAMPDPFAIQNLVRAALATHVAEADTGDYNAGMREIAEDTSAARKRAYARMI